MSGEWQELLDDTRKQFREEIDDERPSDRRIDRYIYETADSAVPVYNRELLELAIDNMNLALEEPDIEAKNAIEMIQHNVYDKLVLALWQEYDQAKAEWKELEEDVRYAEATLEEFLDDHPDATTGEIEALISETAQQFDRSNYEDQAQQRLNEVYTQWKEEHQNGHTEDV